MKALEGYSRSRGLSSHARAADARSPVCASAFTQVYLRASVCAPPPCFRFIRLLFRLLFQLLQIATVRTKSLSCHSLRAKTP